MCAYELGISLDLINDASSSAQSLAISRAETSSDFAGAETLLLIEYEMDSQFEIDRWILGPSQVERIGS
ncbi:MAG: hypothetical protein ACI841_004165 [Planctomycetota bacterium]|jgi:hypothetical protein